MLFLKGDLTNITICVDASFVLHSPFELLHSFDLTDFCEFDYQKEITVSIIPEVIYTDDSLRSLAPEDRNCFFDDEKELEFFKTYSKVNCEMECMTRIALNNCNCTPYFAVRDDTMPLCGLDDSKRIKWETTPDKLLNCGCLERCNSISYRFEIRNDKLSTAYNQKQVYRSGCWISIKNLHFLVFQTKFCCC